MTRSAQPPAAGAAEGAPGSTRAVLMVSITAALGGFLFGYDTSVINGAVDAIESQFGMSSIVTGVVVSSALIGAGVGAWFAGPLADRYGRIRVMLVAALLFFASSIGSALAADPAMLTAWRLLGGLAVGAASVIAPAYIAEIAPAHLRGRLGSLQQLAIVTGIFVALLVDYAMATSAGGSAIGTVPWGGSAWRWMFAAEAVPAVVYGALALRIPESPRHLVKKARVAEAYQVLARFVGGDVRLRVAEIQRSLVDAGDRVHLSDLRGPRFGLLPIVWVGILLSMFQQFVGINVIFYYSSSLWHSIGFAEDRSLLITVITSVTNIVTTLIAIALIDRIGRKPLLIFGASGMIITLTTLAICFGTATAGGDADSLTIGPLAGKIALVAANLYVFFFGMSWGPVVWVLLGEMFNNKIRATALAVAAAAQWAANWLVSTTFPALADIGLALAYGLYASFAVLALLFVISAVRETKGRQLEEM